MARQLRAVVAATVLMVWQLAPQAQGPTFRSAIELVNLNVTVVGSDAQHVPGLTQDQFQVLENGVTQTVRFFTAGETPLDVVLLLDTSSSMTESMPFVRLAASRFVHALRPVDRASVMSVSDGLRVLQTLTSDVAALDQAIKATIASGRTPLYSALYATLHELDKFRRDQGAEPRRQAIVVLTDGHDTSSAFRFEDLLPAVRRHAVPIYAIAPRAARAARLQREVAFGESTSREDFELRTLADETGARAFFPTGLNDLAGIYGDIASELAHQYSLGYQSSNPGRDGAFRRVALRVIAPGVKWRTRSGYLAEAEAR